MEQRQLYSVNALNIQKELDNLSTIIEYFNDVAPRLVEPLKEQRRELELTLYPPTMTKQTISLLLLQRKLKELEDRRNDHARRITEASNAFAVFKSKEMVEHLDFAIKEIKELMEAAT